MTTQTTNEENKQLYSTPINDLYSEIYSLCEIKKDRLNKLKEQIADLEQLITLYEYQLEKLKKAL